jgi:hypothetical protein
MCCAGNVCQADLDEDVDTVRTLQNQIDNAVHLIQTYNILRAMVAISGPGDVDALLMGIFPGVQNDDDIRAIRLNTLRLLAFHNRASTVTRLVEEIEDIEGVRKNDIGILLTNIRARLGLADDSDSPIVELYKRYK